MGLYYPIILFILGMISITIYDLGIPTAYVGIFFPVFQAIEAQAADGSFAGPVGGGTSTDALVRDPKIHTTSSHEKKTNRRLKEFEATFF